MSGVLHGVVASLAGRVTDAFWKYVTLLLNTSATNGAQNNTFLDSSTNNFSITRNGDTTQGSFNPYMPSGYWSGYFDGSGDYLTTPTTTALSFGTGDFTVECWIYKTTAVNSSIIDARVDPGAATPWAFYIDASNFPYFYEGTVYTSSVAVTLNAWVHVAVTRSSGTLRIFVNGVQGYSATVTTNLDRTAGSFIGMAANTATPQAFYQGFISNLRVVKGTAVYTANFTPPTTPLTAITNTSLLCLQDNRFKDNSTNAFAITRNGDTRISKFAPFNPPASYSTASYGGSGYFDGVGDYLSIADSATIRFGTSAFTIQGWVYRGAAGATHTIAAKGGASTGWVLQITSTNVLRFTDTTTNIDTTTTIPASTWAHVAVVRTGTGANGLKLYINAVDSATGTSSTDFNQTDALNIGADRSNANAFNGYVSNLKYTVGTAESISVPASPITGGTVLLNFTNAGIFDAATINDSQTVGNAQVSTTQAKWSPTSMAFDGTGDYVVSPSSINFGYGTGDFTIEFWLYLNSASADQTIVSNLTSVASTNPHIYLLGAGGTIRYYTAGADRITGSALSTGQWYHVAVAKASGSTRLFINGTQSGSTYTDGNNYGTSAPLGVGTYWSAGAPVTTSTLNGYIQDLRITNGYARYTANFTAPTAAFPTL